MRIALACAILALSCVSAPPPPGQLLLYVDTDAPLAPVAGRAPAIGDPPVLFDQLQVDVFLEGQTQPCTNCSRTFAVDADSIRAGRISFGIPHGTFDRARFRLYPSRATISGLVPENTDDDKPPQSVIDVTVALPAIPSEGIAERTVFLETESVGLPIGVDAPIQTIPGRVISGKVGTWDGAQRLPCAGEPALGEVCVPGTAFWMGNPRSIGTGLGNRADRSRLVVVSPFYLQQTEVTVAEWRLFGTHGVVAWSGGSTGNSHADFCTYTLEIGPNEHKPINCVLWSEARKYCQAKGADLPTEAELELVASGMTSQLYVWGSENPTCADAVLGRGGYGLWAGLVSPCMPKTPPGGPEEVGFLSAPRRDRLWTGSGTLYDLDGNIAELTRDEFQQQDGPFWSRGGVYRDPVGKTGVSVHTVRGGDWTVIGNLAFSSARYGIEVTDATETVGFRCARPGL